MLDTGEEIFLGEDLEQSRAAATNSHGRSPSLSLMRNGSGEPGSAPRPTEGFLNQGGYPQQDHHPHRHHQRNSSLPNGDVFADEDCEDAAIQELVDGKPAISPGSRSGNLLKWTNYIHGWQSRFFVLDHGTLQYYKSSVDTPYGCRGAISINKAIFQNHEFDECRFDVSVNDCMWYLRAESADDRADWMDALDNAKVESGYGSQNDLRRHGSTLSLTSQKSLTSASSLKSGSRGLREKLAEIETYRDILCRQIDNLQGYFDNSPNYSADRENSLYGRTGGGDPNGYSDSEGQGCRMVSGNNTLFSSLDISGSESTDSLPQASAQSMDFKGEALTFRATTAAVITTIQHCLDMVAQREESWRKRLEKETDRRRKFEDAYKQALKDAAEAETVARQRVVTVYSSPDYEEGPHSALNDLEWHDALDAALEKADAEDHRIRRLISGQDDVMTGADTAEEMSAGTKLTLPPTCELAEAINAKTLEQLVYAKAGVAEGVWTLFAEDGQMKMFKRDLEIDGLVCDPLKAVHSVQGVTAREYCHYFFESDYKMDWDTTLEDVSVVNRVSQDTIIVHQVHKRIWPSSQRESLFWSHIRSVPDQISPDARDLWIVCNQDTLIDDVPCAKGSLRVGLTVAMVCETVVTTPGKGGGGGGGGTEGLSRDDVMCKIVYVSQVNPGGWAPSSILRTVYKREYPKFLKRFTQYVVSKTQNRPLIM